MNFSVLSLPWDRLEASQVPLDHHGSDHTRKDNLRCGADRENEHLLSPSNHCRAGFESGTEFSGDFQRPFLSLMIYAGP